MAAHRSTKLTLAARIGTAGWTIPRAHAHQLPLPGSHLERFAQVFSCAEINSSFHRPHRDSTWQRWGTSVPDHFRFSVKAPRSITHDAALSLSAASVTELSTFLEQARHLGSKLGPVLFQLPPKQAFDPVRATAFFLHLRSLHTGAVVLEPRHPTWFTTPAETILLRHNIARVAADPAPVPEAARPGGAQTLFYYRLHGAPRVYYSPYTQDQLQSLSAEIRRNMASAETWVIFDNTASGAALGNALDLSSLLASPPTPSP